MDDHQSVAPRARLLAALTATTAALVTVALPGAAQAGVEKHCEGQYVCVGVTVPGKPGTPAKPKAPARHKDGKPSFNLCTVKALKPQPPAGSSLWDGHAPGKGAIYTRSCIVDPLNPGLGLMPGQAFWAADPPATQGPDPATLARQAVDKMLLTTPDIASPKPAPAGGCSAEQKVPAGHGCYVVGAPMWMSLDTSPTTWGPNTASASAGGITVTARAKVSKAVWTMGDGAKVTCTEHGTPYKASYGKQTSPDCGHRYTQPSSANSSGEYRVAVTTTWTIDWEGGGQTGVLTETRNGAVDVAVAEVQVLN